MVRYAKHLSDIKCNTGDNKFFVLLDFVGHGLMGDKVSDFTMKTIPEELRNHPCRKHNIVKAFTEVFRIVDDLLFRQSSIDVSHTLCKYTAILVCRRIHKFHIVYL